MFRVFTDTVGMHTNAGFAQVKAERQATRGAAAAASLRRSWMLI